MTPFLVIRCYKLWSLSPLLSSLLWRVGLYSGHGLYSFPPILLPPTSSFVYGAGRLCLSDCCQSNLLRGLPTGLFPSKLPPKISFGIQYPAIFITWPAHLSLFIRMQVVIFDESRGIYRRGCKSAHKSLASTCGTKDKLITCSLSYWHMSGWFGVRASSETALGNRFSVRSCTLVWSTLAVTAVWGILYDISERQEWKKDLGWLWL